MPRLRKALLAAPCLLAGALLSTSCVQLIGAQDLPKDKHVSQCADDLRYEEIACARCMDQHCCGAVEACDGDPDCAALMHCRALCAPSNAACRLACGPAYAPPSTLVGAALACERQACGDACVACGEYAEVRGAGCAECLSARVDCCDAERAVAKSSVADVTLSCFLACTDPSCAFLCQAAGGLAAYDLFLPLVGCVAQCEHCHDGARFSCAGLYPAIMPPKPTATYSVELRGFGSPLGLPGIEVTACPDPACLHPVDPTTSDHEGRAALTLPMDPVSGFNGYVLYHDAKGRILDQLFSFNNLAVDRVEQQVLVDPKIYGFALDRVGLVSRPGETAGVFLVAGDCRATLAAGVEYELAPPYEKARFYYLGGSLTDPSFTHTDSAFAAGFAVIEPEANGKLKADHVTYAMKVDGKQVGTGTIPLQIGVISRRFTLPAAQ